MVFKSLHLIKWQERGPGNPEFEGLLVSWHCFNVHRVHPKCARKQG